MISSQSKSLREWFSFEVCQGLISKSLHSKFENSQLVPPTDTRDIIDLVVI